MLAIVIWVVLNKTPLGEYFLAVGGNAEASHIAGVPVAMTKIASYVISGGPCRGRRPDPVGRLGAADPTLGNLWELDAIAAAAIGGASLMGGKGSIVGTILGAIILGSLRNGLDPAERPGVLPIARHRPYHPRRDADRSGDKGTGMNLIIERSADGWSAHPHDDAAPHAAGGPGGRHDARAAGLRRGHVAEDRWPRMPACPRR